jgi:hypothetical protein
VIHAPTLIVVPAQGDDPSYAVVDADVTCLDGSLNIVWSLKFDSSIHDDVAVDIARPRGVLVGPNGLGYVAYTRALEETLGTYPSEQGVVALNLHNGALVWQGAMPQIDLDSAVSFNTNTVMAGAFSRFGNPVFTHVPYSPGGSTSYRATELDAATGVFVRYFMCNVEDGAFYHPPAFLTFDNEGNAYYDRNRSVFKSSDMGDPLGSPFLGRLGAENETGSSCLFAADSLHVGQPKPLYMTDDLAPPTQIPLLTHNRLDLSSRTRTVNQDFEASLYRTRIYGTYTPSVSVLVDTTVITAGGSLIGLADNLYPDIDDIPYYRKSIGGVISTPAASSGALWATPLWPYSDGLTWHYTNYPFIPPENQDEYIEERSQYCNWVCADVVTGRVFACSYDGGVPASSFGATTITGAPVPSTLLPAIYELNSTTGAIVRYGFRVPLVLRAAARSTTLIDAP